MDKFKVIIEGNHTQVEAEGSIEDLAFNVCILTNAIYTAYLNNEPIEAEHFKNMVQGLIADSDSPTWKPKKPVEGDFAVITEKNPS